ncbi:PHD finger protein 14 [Stylophora pistillata]|uniref:PHD finger protein 14 n=1 Tax=Stylophora pistillata TaxID=50429 RepID=A0A2B4RVM4_STYPI|nr:PHD finger protein 14 [Stylophora pistillata]
MADKEPSEKDTFLKSILNRGPNKRQIKPAGNNSLLQLALGEDSEDSEEDADFELNDDEDDEGGSGSDEETDITEQQDKEQVAKKVQEVSEDDNDEDDNDDDDNDDEDESESLTAVSALTVGDLIEVMKAKTKAKAATSQPSSVASSEVSASSKKVDILICGICLDDISDEGDEIVECDNCGITVHEGCYGINDEDSDSGKSNDTDSPTELWFCDACKLGVQPDCELCPNLGGIFKETDMGQWVHLLCALYTPDVAFVKPEQLQCVTLSEVPPYKWGAKDCTLCEDERFCRTGVCIECDAGMCRTYFHVTCAQMYGLLSDVPEECDEDVADPLFAHCRLHADKKTTANRRRQWLAYQSRYKKAGERRSVEDKERVKHCLDTIRQEFQAKRMKNLTKVFTPSEKIPRLLSTCPGACRQLFKKAQLLGYTTGQSQSVMNVRRKWFVQPALTSEFVNYYHDRNARLKEMQERQDELRLNNKRLQQEEQDLREKYQAVKHLICATCKTTENQHQLVQCDTCHHHYHLGCVDPPLTRMPKRSAKCLWQCSECDPSEDDGEMEVDPQDTTPISQARHRRVIKEPSKFTPDKGEAKKRKLKTAKRKNPTAQTEDVSKKPKLSSDSEAAPKRGRRPMRRDQEATDKKKKPMDVRTECSVCKHSGTNVNLVRCDSCQLCYHFHCLDPPVKANPKTRGYQWVCKECDESEGESEEDVHVEESNSTDAKTDKKSKEENDKQEISETYTKKGEENKETSDDSADNSSVTSPEQKDKKVNL